MFVEYLQIAKSSSGLNKAEDGREQTDKNKYYMSLE